MPQASVDLDECLVFLSGISGGDPTGRKRDIRSAIDRICRYPKANRIRRRNVRSGIDLRVHHAAQFVIIYAYFEPNAVMPNGMVSIRAIRHRRVRNLFEGVKERVAWGKLLSAPCESSS